MRPSFNYDVNVESVKAELEGVNTEILKQKYQSDKKVNNVKLHLFCGNVVALHNDYLERRINTEIITDNNKNRDYIIRYKIKKDQIESQKQLLFNTKIFLSIKFQQDNLLKNIKNFKKTSNLIPELDLREMCNLTNKYVKDLLFLRNNQRPQEWNLYLLFTKLGFNLSHLLEIIQTGKVKMPLIFKENLLGKCDDEKNINIPKLFYKIGGEIIPPLLKDTELQQVEENEFNNNKFNLVDFNSGFNIDDGADIKNNIECECDEPNENEYPNITLAEFKTKLESLKMSKNEIENKLMNNFYFKVDTQKRKNLDNIFEECILRNNPNKIKSKKSETPIEFSNLIRKLQPKQNKFNTEKEDKIYLLWIIYEFTQDRQLDPLFQGV